MICYLRVVLWVSVILPGFAGGKFKADSGVAPIKIPERAPPKEPEMSAQLTHTLTHPLTNPLFACSFVHSITLY